MGMLKSVWEILTTSKGIKRNIAITMFALAMAAKYLGIELPGNIENEVEKGFEVVGTIIGLYGMWIANRQAKKNAIAKANVIAAAKNDPVIKAADAALDQLDKKPRI
jgi:hypothetical protein